MSWADLLLPSIVLAIVLSLGLYHGWKLGKASKALERALKKCREKLNEIKSEELLAKFDQITTEFREEPLLKHSWHEFDEALVKETETATDGSTSYLRIRNTLQSNEFFSHAELIDEPLGSEFTKHLPGVFTAIGILGTFCGIGLGLVKATKSFEAMKAADENPGLAMELMTQATRDLLSHIGPAFGASFLAVLGAVLFLLFERHHYRKLEKLLSSLQIEVDRLFPRVTQHTLLTELIGHTEKQAASTKNLSNEFATSLRPVLEEIMERQTQAMEKSQAQVLNEMTTTLAKSFEPLAEKLNETVLTIKKDTNDSSTATIERLVGSFQNSLSNAAGSQFEEMSAAISGTASLLNSQKESLDNFVSTISREMETQLRSMAEQMNEQQVQAQQASLENSRQITELTSRLGESFQSLQQKTTDSSTELLRDMSTGINDLLKETMDTQKTANQALMSTLEESNAELARSLQALTEGLEAMSRRIAESTDSLVERMSASTGSTITELSKTVSDATSGTVEQINGSLTNALEKIAEQTGQLFRASEDQNARMSHRLTEMTKAFESSATETTSKAADTSKALEGALDKVSITAKEIDQMIARVKAQTDNFAAVSANAREASAQFKVVGDGLLEQQKKSQTFIDNVGAVEQALKAQTQAVQYQQATLKEVLEGFERSAIQLTNASQEQAKVATDVGAKTQVNLTKFQDSINSTTKTLENATVSYFKEIDQALSSITGHLRGTIEDLSEPLQELADSLGARS